MLEERRKAVKRLEERVLALQDEEALLAKVDEVLLHVSSKVLGASTDKIDGLLQAGLRLVFDDQDLAFRTEVDRHRGKTSIEFHLKAGGVEAPIMEAYGGGVLVVAGVLIRVVTIMVLGMERVLILDESLSHLSGQYVPGASRLLRKLGDELGFTILAVTHDDALAEQADRHYVARAKGGATVFTLEDGQDAAEKRAGNDRNEEPAP